MPPRFQPLTLFLLLAVVSVASGDTDAWTKHHRGAGLRGARPHDPSHMHPTDMSPLRPHLNHHIAGTENRDSTIHKHSGPGLFVSPDRQEARRRLVKFRDWIAKLSGKNEKQLLLEAKHKLEQLEQRGPVRASHRRLPQYELGTTFHVLRFFSNRIGEVNDKHFTQMEEEEAARLAALGASSSSSSSSLDADAQKAAEIEASRAKAAAAYGLKNESGTSSTAGPSEPPTTTAPASPSPTMKSLLASIEW